MNAEINEDQTRYKLLVKNHTIFIVNLRTILRNDQLTSEEKLVKIKEIDIEYAEKDRKALKANTKD